MEYVVHKVEALETPHTLTEQSTGKVFPMVTLRLSVMRTTGQYETLLLHFAPTHMQSLIPNVQESIQRALALATSPSEDPKH
jgi:hypothetical protein